MLYRKSVNSTYEEEGEETTNIAGEHRCQCWADVHRVQDVLEDCSKIIGGFGVVWNRS